MKRASEPATFGRVESEFPCVADRALAPRGILLLPDHLLPGSRKLQLPPHASKWNPEPLARAAPCLEKRSSQTTGRCCTRPLDPLGKDDSAATQPPPLCRLDQGRYMPVQVEVPQGVSF